MEEVVILTGTWQTVLYFSQQIREVRREKNGTEKHQRLKGAGCTRETISTFWLEYGEQSRRRSHDNIILGSEHGWALNVRLRIWT